MRLEIEGAVLELVQGDITVESTEAIVNAANSSLLGGGGVDGAIHSAGGPAILEECKKVRAAQGPLPTGKAVITTGGRLKARYVIHTVGPIWRGGQTGEAELLRSSYLSCMAIARQQSIRTIAFPSVSTGVYGYPVRPAAGIALGAVAAELVDHPGAIDRVRFVLFDPTTLQAYSEALAELRAAAASSPRR